MTLYKNKYRIESARYKKWNYAQEGGYFVTVCTKDRHPYFGMISEDAVMNLSPTGKIVVAEWLRTPDVRPDMNLTLGAFVVMPNHFHAILIIGANAYNSGTLSNTEMVGVDGDNDVVVVETHCNASLQQQQQNQFGPQRKNLASVIRGFKSAVTTQAHIIHPEFAWQPRFHDHIIRNEQEYNRIADYIHNNPRNWKGDKFYSPTKPAT